MVKNRFVCQVAVATDANIYASGDQIGVPVEIEAFSDGVGAIIRDLLILDKDGEKSAIDVLLFNNLPLLSSVDNGPFAFSAAAEIEKCVGVVVVLAADYADAGTGYAVATKQMTGLVVQNKGVTDSSKKKKLWAVLVSRGTPDYDSKPLMLKLGMEQS